jgi:fructose-1-phosphate kinase PfkB-like protein
MVTFDLLFSGEKACEMIQQPEIASKPIVTLALSPTIDLAFQSNAIKPIRKNRAVAQRTDAGGGGINVARVLKELGVEAHAIYLVDAATSLVATGAVENLAVTMGCDGALFASRSGTLRLKGPKAKPVSAVGAGDNFVAGMTSAFARRENVEHAFMRGMVAGAATVLTHGTQLCRREDVERLHAEVVAERASL